MRTMLCVAILSAIGFVVPNLGSACVSRVTFIHPASARDLHNFYRAIQALSADSILNGTAIAIV